MGEADAIGSPIIQESEGRRRRRHWFTGGFICPLRVTCRLQAVRKPSANGPWLTARKPPSVRAALGPCPGRCGPLPGLRSVTICKT